MNKLTILVLFFLASCTSTNKHKTVTSSKVDSVSHVKVDSVVNKKKATTQVKRDNTVKKVQADKVYTKETITVYDTVRLAGPQQIKYIIVREKGVDKSKTTTKTDTKDSTVQSDQQQAAVNKTADTELHKEVKAKEKVVKRTSFNWWWLLLLLLIPAYYFGRKYWPYIKAAFLIF